MDYKEAAAGKRREIETAVIARYGGVSARREALLDMYEENMAAYLAAKVDVEKTGLRETYVNGRQRVTRKNICFDQMTKATATLTRLLNAILPDDRKGSGPPGDEAGDEDDDDLDDY